MGEKEEEGRLRNEGTFQARLVYSKENTFTQGRADLSIK